jgi:hypothetical protein
MAVRIALILAAAVVAGCAGDSDESSGIPEQALAKTVLQLADLPEPFLQFDEGRQSRTDTTGPLRTNPARFGRIDGWKARFRRPGTQTTAGPLVIESRVDLFETADGAVKDLGAYRKELRGADGGRVLTLPLLGAEAVGITFREDRVRFFRIAWRHENATALLFVNGFDGRLQLGDVLALARKQQRRLANAGS